MRYPAEHDPVLVTGAAGFVGAGVTRELLARGHLVHVLLRDPDRAWRLHDVLDRLLVHQGDLLDGDWLAQTLRDIRPATVVHLATHGAYEVQDDARLILRTNLLGTYNLLEACEDTGARLFVNAGSSSEYGLKSEPMRESDHLEPDSWYAVGKAGQTHLATLFARRGRLAVVTCRLFSVFGPWEEPSRLVPTLLQRARAGLPLLMTSPATARDFIYLDDVVAALLDFPRLLGQSGEVINLGSGTQTTLAQLIEAIQNLFGRRLAVRWGAMRDRSWDTTCWQADIAEARQRLAWQPHFSLAEGLARTAIWLAAREEADVCHAG